MDRLWKLIREVEPEMVSWRRDIHAHPEPGFEEVRTAGLIAGVLKGLGLKVRTGVGGTGVVGDLEVGGKRRVGLRADMDALRMTEENDVPYRSQRTGVAHMCGHDAHVAMALATAKVLTGMKEELKQNVRFLFQPCEETPPGGGKGMVEAGVLEGVDEIYALHVDASQPSGVLSVREGAVMASSDRLEIMIEGQGGHAAAPHTTHDPVTATAEVIQALQTIASRRVDPVDPVVVSICQIEAGSAYNIIPSRVHLVGTFRTACRETRERIPGLLREITSAAAAVHGCSAVVTVTTGYPLTVNDAGAVERVRSAAGRVFENPKQLVEDKLRMGSEDFSYYLERVPGAIVWLGIRNAGKGIVAEHHHPRFDVDETALANGVALLAGLALS